MARAWWYYRKGKGDRLCGMGGSVGKVILDMAMSLDGFAAGPNGEDRGLNDWFFSPAGRSREIIEESIASTGAIVMGRRAYGVGDDAEGFSDTPYDAAHFVLTSKPPASTPKGNVSFTFVTDGIDSALEQARAAAGARNVAIGGGPSTAQGFVGAGVLDEIQVHLIPVLLGEGIRLFGRAGRRLNLAPIRVVEAPDATHLRYRVAH
jgi:dihydrofolate reductase